VVKCLTELLKQPSMLHYLLDNEIISIFAGVNGYLENSAPFKKAIIKDVYTREFNFLIKLAILMTNNVINKNFNS
jgi:F0F1-type ATP synthase alpha subunit